MTVACAPEKAVFAAPAATAPGPGSFGPAPSGSPATGSPAIATSATSRATAARPSRASGLALMLLAATSNQTGAATGALAFPVIGPVGVVAVRQLVTAALLTPIVRPRFRGLTPAQWQSVLGLAAVFSVMNIGLYVAVDRIGLALAVTLEFLGPLTVAIVSSRGRFEYGCAGLAAVGVVVLTSPGPSTDFLGIAAGLVAATAWGLYIVLNQRIGRQLPGLQGTALASAVAAAVWLPVAVFWFSTHPPTGVALALAAACGVLCSLIPYVADLVALRTVPAQVYGTFTSINPVWAAFAGWALLGQPLAANEWAGIGLIALSNILISARPHRAASAECCLS